MGLPGKERCLSRRGTWEGGCSMDRQRWLPFEDYEQLDMLWTQFPEAERLKVVKLYGRLMAREAGWKPEHSEREEGSREHDDE
jgi:hypothetical protein